MRITLEITVESLQNYLEVLRLLGDSQLSGQYTAKLALQSLPELADAIVESERDHFEC